MGWTAAHLVGWVLMVACRTTSPVPPEADPGPGIPLALAEQRARVLHDVRYALSFDLPADLHAPVGGRATISFRIDGPATPLVLDFAPGANAVTAVAIGAGHAATGGHVGPPARSTDGGASAAGLATEGVAARHALRPLTSHRFVHNHLVIPPAELVQGENVVTVDFRAGDDALNRNPEFLYTLFVPARAHLTFPCFDQPDIKARYSLQLTVPPDWQAVANGAEVSRENLEGGRLRVSYAETPPLPTYLFAFAAGRFQVEAAERAGRTYRIFHRETDAQKLARNRDAIVDLHAGALAWLEGYTQIPYPFGKFDVVAVPSFQFSGMEHPGAILYNASSLLLDQSATESQMLQRASTIAHETAHMWFGDLVTMRWFDDVWMKEVFANFMAAKIVNPAFPTIDHDLRFLLAHYPAAYAVDRTEGTHEIRQPLDNLSDAGSQYGPIIYQKAPIVMRQLERLIGEDGMRDGLRVYLKEFAYRNATWLDLIGVLDKRSDRDLAAWSRAWVEEGGRPTVRTEIETDEHGSVRRIGFAQSDPRADRGLTWTQQMEVLVGAAGRSRSVSLELGSDHVDLPLDTLRPRPDFVLPTGGGLAYGAFVVDEGSRRYLLSHVHELDDPVTRGATWVTLWDEVLDARIAPAVFVSSALRALPRESVQQNVSLLVRYITNVFWRLLPVEERAALLPQLERAFRDGWEHAGTASLKSTYFSAFRSVAGTPEGLAFLERVWARTEHIPGLPLAEADEATLALEIAVREVPSAPAVLETQRHRFANPDRKARFEFVMPALSADSAVRDAWFKGLSDSANRRREPWVSEGLFYLNHPLRAEPSEVYVRPALDMLQEIQRTGDIFFPSNWMNAALNGHASSRVAETVRAFLAEQPDYPPRLRRIILQSADDVFRAAAIRAAGSTAR